MAGSESYRPDATPDVEAAGSFIAANRLKLLLGALVVLGALGYFGTIAFQSATVYYYTVGEAASLGPTEDGRLVRVNGKLIPATFSRPEGSTEARFDLTDGSRTMSAVHDGVLPELFFNDHSEIILEGSFDGDMVFHSENVIVKCPSKYVAKEEETG